MPTLYAAKKYMVNPLVNECINYLEKNLKPENVCVILMQVCTMQLGTTKILNFLKFCVILSSLKKWGTKSC